MKNKHTPTYELISGELGLIANVNKRKFIILAVSMHNELVECLKWTQGMTTEKGWKTFDAWAKRLIAQAEGRE